MERGIGLKELIREITRELRTSQEEREKSGEAPLFRVKELEVEVSFVVEKSVEGKGGAEFWVLSLGGSAGSKTETVHRMTLRLEAAPPAEGPSIGVPMDPSVVLGKAGRTVVPLPMDLPGVIRIPGIGPVKIGPGREPTPGIFPAPPAGPGGVQFEDDPGA